ncbi:hypothetical protein H6F59_18555 [Nodosilinea sp. FACHB-141]|uniref:GIY-YIG catalytic domain-containing protein n=2 Tax=Cyanobacteriota TaxID=1117 RepID=A0ABV0K6F4_9CYAN|nr:hypothetical protein [Nodosilinea sp. FACHB-141]MBD2113828.1 hypothetical protein [Nodosilinea sp. FACHB-141]
MLIYIGDGRDVIKRIRKSHLTGNVEASSLRKHLAVKMGFGISVSKRLSGSQRIRIALPEPKEGEHSISEYLANGWWQYVICDSYEEANAFQWYAIEKLKPQLNKDRRSWDVSQLSKFEILLNKLQNSQCYRFDELVSLSSGAGVYAFHHHQCPILS